MDNTETQPQQEQTYNTEQAKIAAKSGLNKWVFRRGYSFVTGKVLEIDEGEGHVAKYCEREGVAVNVLPVNLNDDSFDKTYAGLLGSFDLVYFLRDGIGLLDNKSALANSASLLRPGGYFITVLPCKTALYLSLLQGINDWLANNKRYYKTILSNHYSIEKTRYFEVMEELPSLEPPEGEYEETVRLFQKTITNDFVPTGLFVLLIGKKK